MKTNEIIAALRYCQLSQHTNCWGCPANIGDSSCLDALHKDAADALEAQQKRIEELEKSKVVEVDQFNRQIGSHVMTHADRIRAMSGEELEDFIRNIAIHCEPWCDNHCKMDGDDDCNRCLAKWLQQPAEVSGDA